MDERTRWLAVGLVAVSILVVSVVPIPGAVPEESAGLSTSLLFHLGGYAILSTTLSAALGTRRTTGRSVAVAVVATTGYGAAIEALQLAIPYRTGDPVDVAVNAVGALVGASVWWVGPADGLPRPVATAKIESARVPDMYHVLLAVAADDDLVDTQIDAVRSLPEAPEAVEVTVFHCFGKNPSGASVAQVGSARRARDELEDAGLAVRLDESSGDPAEAIIDAAREYDVDAICLAGRKRTPAGKVLFGSVTQGVILGTDRPVIVCG